MRTALQKNTAIRLFYDSTESELNHEYTIDGVLGSGANCFVYNAHWTGCDGQAHHVRLKECFPARAEASRLPTHSVHWEDTQEKEIALKRFYHAYEACLQFQTYTETNNATAHIIDGLLWGNSTRYVVIDVDEGTVYSSIINDSIHDMFKTILALTQITRKYHDAGYLLLDIKPDNLLILPETRELIKIIDFDSILSKNDIRNKETPISYSYDFAAPELCAGDRKRICDATDFYSIGTIAFKAIMGRLPTVDDCNRFSNWDFSRLELFNTVGPRAIRLTKDFFHKTLSASTSGRYHDADTMILAIKTLVTETDTSKVFLAGTRPYSTSYFIGREEELKQIHQAFMSGYRSVFISGIGGIGKTVLAKQYAEKYRNNYDTICFGLYTNNTTTLLSDQSFIKIVRGDSFNTTEERIRQLRTLVDEHTLLIIDNYEANDSDDYFDSLLELDCKILITSRSEHSEHFSETLSSKHISVSSLQNEECWQLFCRYYPKAEYLGTRSIIERLFSMVANHTLFITLLAKNFVASGLTPTDMLKHFTDDGMYGISTSIIRHQKDKNVTATIAGHFETLFKISDLTDAAKNVLACLSLLGDIRINKRELAQMCGCHLDIINLDLIERGWLHYDFILEEVSMHPIVSTTIRNILNPTSATFGVLKDYLDSIVLALHYTDTDSYYPFQPINTLDQVDFDNRVTFLIEFFKHLPLNDPESLEYIAEALFDLSTVLGIAPDGIDIDLLYDKDLVERIADFLSMNSVSELTSFMAYGFGAFVWVESLRTIYANDNEQRHVVAYTKAFDYYQKSVAALKQAKLSVDSRKQHAMKLLWRSIEFFSGLSYLFEDRYLELSEYVRNEFTAFSLEEMLDDEQLETYNDFIDRSVGSNTDAREGRRPELKDSLEQSSIERTIDDPGPDADPSEYYSNLLFECPDCYDEIQSIVKAIISDSRLDRKSKFRIIEGNTLFFTFVPKLYLPPNTLKQYHNIKFLNGIIWIKNTELTLLPNESDTGYSEGWVWEGYTIGDDWSRIEAYMQLAAANILLGNHDQVAENMQEVQFEVNYALQHQLNPDSSLDYQALEVENMYISFLFTMFAVGCAKQITVYLEDYIEQIESYGGKPYSLYDLALRCAQELNNKQMEYKYRVKIGAIAGTSFRYEE